MKEGLYLLRTPERSEDFAFGRCPCYPPALARKRRRDVRSRERAGEGDDEKNGGTINAG